MLLGYFSRLLRITFFIALFGSTLSAQSIGTWSAHSSYRSVWNMTQDSDGHTWVATGGGLFGIIDEETVAYTTVDGLYRFKANAITYDEVNHSIWLGYDDGMLQEFSLDTRRFRTVNDIHRATSFNPRGVNQLVMKGDTLLIATDFGVVLYDVQRNLTIDTYRGFGFFPAGTRVNSIFVQNDVYYLATAQGVAIGNERTSSLIVPSSWTAYGANTALGAGEVFSVVPYKGFVYANKSTNKFRFNGSNWQSWSGVTEAIQRIKYDVQQDQLIFIRNFDAVLFKSEDEQQVISTGFFTIVRDVVVTPEVHYMIGTSESGVVRYVSGTERPQIFPEGPFMNLFTAVNYDAGVLYTGTTRSGGGERLNAFAGYNFFEEGQWRTFNTYLTPELQSFAFNNVISSLSTSDYFYFGSEGGGVVRHRKSDDDIKVFQASNSSLTGFSQTYFVATGLAQSREGLVWLAGWASRPFKVFYQEPGADDWQTSDLPAIVGINDQVRHIFVDTYNQKWISLESSIGEGRGVLVWNTGTDLTTTADDQAFILTTELDRGFLPDPYINVMRTDKRGEVWVGTRRGVVRYVFPERIISGNAADRRAEYLRSANNDSLLLRDFNVRDIKVNAANQKWIATADNGAWLMAPNGDRVLLNYTTQNSPLPSNDVQSIGINDDTGEVYFATAAGLVSFVAEVKAGSLAMNQLKVFPNPYSYTRNSGDRIYIEGLSDETTIRIITVDGKLIKLLEANGGRASWDGLDYNGRKVGTGVYIVVALEQNGSQKGLGKLVIAP